jgi:outer membrane protein assembly factor BamB
MKRLNKKMIALFALSLIVIMSASLILLPNTNAHSPAWEIPTFAYLGVGPNPVGVGQRAGVFMWLTNLMPSSTVTNDIRFHNFNLTITKPDGTTETHIFNVIEDTTSSQFYQFTPDVAGNYTFLFTYPGEQYPGTGAYEGDTFLPSISKPVQLTVQEEAVPEPIGSYPLPTEYWTRPIEGQNTDWWTISSNWLGSYSPQISQSRFQYDGAAPSSSHIMWTKPLQDGGVVGGSHNAVEGNMYYQGLDYNYRFNNPLIMYGRLYYELPLGNSAGGGGFMCVDLRTGEQIWYRDDIPAPSFGYLYAYQMYNQYGVVPPGYLFTNNFARAFDPLSGKPLFNVTNVPSGTGAYGPSGEILRYTINAAGHWITQWNSSKVFQTQTSGSLNGGTASSYDWNITVPWLMSGATLVQVSCDDILYGRNGTLPTLGTSAPFTLWAMSLKPDDRGTLLWMKNFDAPPSNQTLLLGPVDFENHVFTMVYRETMVWYGYSLDTGEKLWGPTEPENPWAFYDYQQTATGFPKVAYGKLYVCGFDGICYAYDMKNGSLLWTYGNGGEGNSTYAGFTMGGGGYDGHFPIFINVIADGKLYIHTSEHSPNTPLYKGMLVRCIDANNGTELWTLTGSQGSQGAPPGAGGGLMGSALADGFYVYFNTYDSQIYSIGKGPSAMTVEAPMTAASLGSSVVIRGSITDISAGTQQKEQAARFPNGVPAVSDTSMKEWMEYVYMQKPKPTNTTGVLVKLYVIDTNNNYRPIGETTSDTDGFFSLNWKPDIEGKYTVIAKFDGSESYWPSHATTAFAVDPAPATPAPTDMPPQSIADLYFVPAITGLFVAIIAVGALMTMLLLKKRP